MSHQQQVIMAIALMLHAAALSAIASVAAAIGPSGFTGAYIFFRTRASLCQYMSSRRLRSCHEMGAIDGDDVRWFDYFDIFLPPLWKPLIAPLTRAAKYASLY